MSVDSTRARQSNVATHYGHCRTRPCSPTDTLNSRLHQRPSSVGVSLVSVARIYSEHDSMHDAFADQHWCHPSQNYPTTTNCFRLLQVNWPAREYTLGEHVRRPEIIAHQTSQSRSQRAWAALHCRKDDDGELSHPRHRNTYHHTVQYCTVQTSDEPSRPVKRA